MPAAPRPFEERYLAGELAPFFDLPPGDIASAISRRLERPREEVAAALLGEARRLGAPEGVSAALARLAHPRSRVVVTGQQPGLLLGPAYTLSKALSAIALARELDSEEAPVVPVFWVASQDHDTAEVDQTFLLGSDEVLRRLTIELPDGVPSGRIPFDPNWIAQICRDLAGAAAKREYLDEIQALVAEAAGRAESYADFFSALLYRLLGNEGLIVLDPSRPALAPFFREILERELEEPIFSVAAINDAAVRLRELGFEPQLGRGREATNLFIEVETDALPRRELLRFDGSDFHTATRSYSRQELADLLCQEPGRITPAAGLRPVAQDAVLPTAALVVGPGELRYLAQLRGVYQAHGVPMPLVWPRAAAVVLEPPVRRILEKFGLSFERYASSPEEALEQVLLERHGHADSFATALQRLEEEAAVLRRHVAAIDPTLEGTVDRSRARVEQTIELLRDKAAKALARQDETTSRQFDRLAIQLFPSGVPQERCLGPFSFFLKFGVGPMMDLYRTIGASGLFLLEP